MAFSLSACATAANRRALYYPAKPGGLWHDYETRRLAEARTGINTAAYSTAPAGPATKMPASGPVTSGSDIGAPPPTNGPTSQVPGIPAPAPAADNGLPTTPGASAVPASPTSTDSIPVAPPN